MASYGVASSPVYDNATIKPLGMADVRLIANFIVSMYSTHSSTTRVIGEQLVAALLAPPSSPLLVLSALHPVSEALTHMAGRRRHIIVQFPSPHCAQRLLSRTDVVRWLCNFPKSFAVFDRSLTSLKMDKPGRLLVTMSDAESAIDGLRRLRECDLAALPVLSRGRGQVVATLSCSVVRYLDLCTNARLLHDLRLPVLEFLRRYHPPSLETVLCKPSDMLLPTVTNTLTHGVHRAWVVDEQLAPIACVTLSDVLRLVMATSLPAPMPMPMPMPEPVSAALVSSSAVAVSLS